ncbi:hypothetical protein GPECTOR_18g139 [Gonium pectorale]|uniref:Uncharacterized protein n=1 Tax=Gonium pectorale TaxID=33097 RepID=A0A150GJK1_GONPE|nr:hypothetical protein GPECTOR_18g139 [Gonium pectorale]|eukprot:KXZ49983.1 hypothetical protein GPECTOR_18g139 [Gonium pectorale]
MLSLFGLAVLLAAIGLVIAASSAGADAGGFQVAEVQGVKTRSGRQLQQSFGSSSIVPLVIDDSPCVSFNADDASPVLDHDGNIVGYTTVHSNAYDAEGLSVLRLDVVVLNFEVNYYFASVKSTNATSNIRAHLSTALPNGCPSTAPSLLSFSKGLTVDCEKRRTTLDMSVPTSLFNCTTATTEDFSIVFFLQLEVDLAPQQCAASTKPFYAGGIYNAIPYGSGCSYVMVTAACKPSTCFVDTTDLSEEVQLTKALGATGRIAGPRVQRASSAYDTGISSVNAAVVGGLVGGVLLAAAVVIAVVLFRRRNAAAAGLHHARRTHSVASEYLDADRFDDSFTIDTGGGGGGAGSLTAGRYRREARRASRLSTSRPSVSRPSMSASVLRAMQGAGRWRDKFGAGPGGEGTASGGTGTASGGAPGVAAGVYNPAADLSVADGSQALMQGPYSTAGAGGVGGLAGGMSMAGEHDDGELALFSHARIPSIFFSPRAPSVFAQPRTASVVGMPSGMMPAPAIELGSGRSAPSVSRARRSSMVALAPTVPMVLDRAATSTLALSSPSEGMPADLAPPDDASSVFLNPLALLRGNRGRDRSGSSSPRLLSMATLTSALGSVGMRRTPPRSTMATAAALAAAAEERSDGPLIRMIVEEEAQGANSSDGSGRQTGNGASADAPAAAAMAGAGAAAGGGGGSEITPQTSSRLYQSVSRRGMSGGSWRPGPVAEGLMGLSGIGDDSHRAAIGAGAAAAWPGRLWEGGDLMAGTSIRRRSPGASGSGAEPPAAWASPPSTSTSGESTASGGPFGAVRAGGSLRSILPRPPPLVLPSPVDAAAMAASPPPSGRLSRPFTDMRASLASSSRGSLQSMASLGSSRSSRSLQVANFSANVIIPVFQDQALCATLNAEDASPLLDKRNATLGWVTVQQGSVNSTTGDTVLQVDLTAHVANLFLADSSSQPDLSNVRTCILTEPPTTCPATSLLMYHMGETGDCSKRRATVEVPIPPHVFSCNYSNTTQPYTTTFYLQVEVDLSTNPCSPPNGTYYAGSRSKAVRGCTYITVQATCRPSTCDPPLAYDQNGVLVIVGPKPSGAKNLLPLVIGVSVGSGVLILALLGGFIYIRKRWRDAALHRKYSDGGLDYGEEPLTTDDESSYELDFGGHSTTVFGGPVAAAAAARGSVLFNRASMLFGRTPHSERPGGMAGATSHRADASMFSMSPEATSPSSAMFPGGWMPLTPQPNPGQALRAQGIPRFSDKYCQGSPPAAAGSGGAVAGGYGVRGAGAAGPAGFMSYHTNLGSYTTAAPSDGHPHTGPISGVVSGSQVEVTEDTHYHLSRLSSKLSQGFYAGAGGAGGAPSIFSSPPGLHGRSALLPRPGSIITPAAGRSGGAADMSFGPSMFFNGPGGAAAALDLYDPEGLPEDANAFINPLAMLVDSSEDDSSVAGEYISRTAALSSRGGGPSPGGYAAAAGFAGGAGSGLPRSGSSGRPGAAARAQAVQLARQPIGATHGEGEPSFKQMPAMEAAAARAVAEHQAAAAAAADPSGAGVSTLVIPTLSSSSPAQGVQTPIASRPSFTTSPPSSGRY